MEDEAVTVINTTAAVTIKCIPRAGRCSKRTTACGFPTPPHEGESAVSQFTGGEIEAQRGESGHTTKKSRGRIHH